MLKVPTYVDNSPIGGLGLFAGRDIEEGELVWEFDPKTVWILSKEEVEALPKRFIELIHTYSYLSNGNWYFCVDNSRFMNHSDDPNTIEVRASEDIDSNPMGKDRAIRRIKAGEELTCNYKKFDQHWSEKLPN
ncbi:SET domain-containing protein-lysine N-methyltransferase [Leptospira perolatii]|uniref:SET domain-containing protein-lysine N-methyltransferase n=1 Tax=Leptospira perolatii TaxID=2023191 RepID=A0A2M9ZRI5_9LEPT|nr:SET domain-containing protein [Leptospira perolatii]PJZ71122.1 SET domain-containing protein-lysine N-methyltransferase [Leptospira perolatii]PJZ74654.1 SET domain-containing protein-lysine N-methyltransferase [Leptospira perolatii]